MIARKIYWRRKDKNIIAEGKINNKTIYLFNLPPPEEVVKSSLFTQEKQEKIMEKIRRLDYKSDSDTKQLPEVRIRKIARTPEKDDLTTIKPSEEQLKQLWELTKE